MRDVRSELQVLGLVAPVDTCSNPVVIPLGSGAAQLRHGCGRAPTPIRQN